MKRRSINAKTVSADGPVEYGVIGVLGGMGPLATLDFMRKILDATPANLDQEHVPVIASSIPQVPDRTRAFHGTGPTPLHAMIKSGQRLVAAGAGLIVIPCNTAHLWFDPLQAELDRPMLHMVDAAIEEVIERAGSNQKVGLLATAATLESGLYAKRAARIKDARLQWVLPSTAEMAEWVTPAIAAVKAGDLASAVFPLLQATSQLANRGAKIIVLGCTEIPLALHDGDQTTPLVDATAALARQAVRWSRQFQTSRHANGMQMV